MQAAEEPRRSVDVWWFELDVDTAGVEACVAVLSAQEADRVAGLATPELRRRATVRFGTRRARLAHALEVAPHELDLRSEPSGRPFVVSPDGARYCVSSSSRDDLAVVACSRDTAVGVDVEALRELGTAPRLVEEVATPRERAELESLGDAERAHALLALWTRKEALLKAVGTGIGAELARVTVPVGDVRGAVAFRPSKSPLWWRLHALACPRDGYGAALVVAMRGEDEPESLVRVSGP